MASTAQLRQWWVSYLCDTSRYERVEIPGVDRTWSLWVARPTVPLFRAFAQVMRNHRYYFRESAGGTYNCRKIGGSDNWSLHAYAIAIDLNPSVNRFGNPLRHDFPPGFVEDVEALTTGGRQAFTWGGRWPTPDAMHFQIDVAPSHIEEDDMPLTPEEIQRIADTTATAVANVKIKRGADPTKYASWLQETADIKSLLLAGGGDVSDADLADAVDRLIEVLPAKTLAALKSKL